MGVPKRFKKEDLIYKDYVWLDENTDKKSSHVAVLKARPDSDVLDRMSGDEVLSFINSMAKTYHLLKKSSYYKIEVMLRNRVPDNLHTIEDIKRWIVWNWEE